MASSVAFEWLCSEIEESTDLDRLEARGTVRIALKTAGLEARAVTAEQSHVILEKLMPAELEGRGVADAKSICSKLIARLGEIPASETDDDESTPEDVFARLA